MESCAGNRVAGNSKAVVTVYVYNPDPEEYTKLEVSKSMTGDTEFSIFWLAPEQQYKIDIDFDENISGYNFEEETPVLEPGQVFYLNIGNPI